MKSLKNWDNKTWLSSRNYINSFNQFLLKNIELNSNSIILDVGCGRGKILGNLSTKLKLKSKPIGLDIENHKDKDKRIVFTKTDAIKFLSNNRNHYDLILIKQTIHLLKIREIKKLINHCKKYLKPNGCIAIFTLDFKKNEIPTFELMNNKLLNSLRRDSKIISMLNKGNKKSYIKKFIYNVKILKTKYQQMIFDRYMSTLLNFSVNQIDKGIKEIDLKYHHTIRFKDKLICLIIKN